MIVEPKVRGFICTTAHPEGCKESVKRQIDYVKRHEQKEGPKKALIIGASTGYGLATRISLAYTYGAATLGVMFEKTAKENRTATPGYYNTVALEDFLHQDGYYGESINGDAFSREVKDMTIAKIKEDLGQVDMVIYSLAAPRRTDEDGVTHSSVLKTTSIPYTNKTLDLRNNQISEVTVPAATKEEEIATVKVMGGEDWALWINALKDAGVLSEGVITIAYSYIGPEITYPIYFEGTIGKAKEDLYQTSVLLNETLKDLKGSAYISVNKALVTQASAAIPVVPLYISILYKIMKEQNLHEGCIEQMDRLFYEKFEHLSRELDDQQRIRMDDYEMLPEVQEKVTKAWELVTTENLSEYADLKGYWEEFYHMFGFRYDTIDYTKEVEI